MLTQGDPATLYVVCRAVACDLVEWNLQVVIFAGCSGKTEIACHTKAAALSWIFIIAALDLTKHVRTPGSLCWVVYQVSDINQVVATSKSKALCYFDTVLIGQRQIHLQSVLVRAERKVRAGNRIEGTLGSTVDTVGTDQATLSDVIAIAA